MEELLQRFSTSQPVTWLTTRAVVLAAAGSYALMLFWTMPFGQVRYYKGPLRFPDVGPDQMIGLCFVLALPILLVRRLPAAVFAAVLVEEAALGDLIGVRPWIVLLLLPVLAGHLAARRPVAAAVGSVAAVATGFAERTLVPHGESVGDAARGAGQFAFVFAVAWVFGVVYRKRREYLEALHEQTEARAVMAERLRIARELHDSVAHSIGIITVLSGAAA
ncbi:histidine kinase, partial [Kitasatospora sp. NPDC059599]|uniref:histidine kinase n=1 Tax=Kitasatospora sp. NPDC059599 TaxID=3346880 RepID=UPI0036C3841C